MEKQAPNQSNKREELCKAAREASSSPGVYLMKDDQGAILYVGKAKSLRNRITTYFQAALKPSPRTEMLVQRVDHFEVILTETESEALILECTLIKKYRPKFNVLLKDDKNFPYIRIQMNDSFPRLEWTRRVRKDGAKYFGPYSSAWAARQVMYHLNQLLKLRDCSDNTFRHRSRACILHQMGRCSAPCVAMISEENYRESVFEAVKVLEGKGDRLLESLSKAMTLASENEEYEVAAQYRDQIQNLQTVTETQAVIEAGIERNRDVLGIAREGEAAHGAVLLIRGGKLIAARHYHLKNADATVIDSELLFDFMTQYYLAQQHEDTRENAMPPSEILLPFLPSDLDLLDKTLGLSLRLPESKEEQQLVNVARVNAEHGLQRAARAEAGHDFAALEDVQEKLQLDRIPQRIECYDISNIQGEDAVASRVVFVDGAPDKNLYRRYKIKTVQGANDFAMMKEVLGRRFAHKEEALPDLVVVDGGKGQLSQAVAILEELNIQGVGVVGLAKARVERNFQKKEVESSMERIFIPGRKNPVGLKPFTHAYKLLTHVRDEAHRFAVSYHRHVRAKRSLKG